MTWNEVFPEPLVVRIVGGFRVFTPIDISSSISTYDMAKWQVANSTDNSIYSDWLDYGFTDLSTSVVQTSVRLYLVSLYDRSVNLVLTSSTGFSPWYDTDGNAYNLVKSGTYWVDRRTGTYYIGRLGNSNSTITYYSLDFPAVAPVIIDPRTRLLGWTRIFYQFRYSLRDSDSQSWTDWSEASLGNYPYEGFSTGSTATPSDAVFNDAPIVTGDIQAGAITASKINVVNLSAITADLGTITAGTITGGTMQTTTAGNYPRVVFDSTGFRSEISAGNYSFIIDAATGQATFSGNIGATSFTGSSFQTAASNPRLILNSLGLVSLTAAGTTPFFLDAASGVLSSFGQASTGGNFTSGVFQTAGTSNNKVMLRSDGLTAYSTTGTPFRLDTAGNLTLTGASESGSSISASSISGSRFQIGSSILLDALGIRAYSGSTTPFFLDTSGNLTVTGEIATGGSYTGGAFQTSASSNNKVLLRSDGLTAYGSTTTPFRLDTSGNLTLTGTVNASVLTGSRFQAGGVYLDPLGIRAFTGSTTPFNLDTSGNLTLTGTIVASTFQQGTYSGGGFTGGVFQTAATSNNKVMLRSDGLYAFASTTTPFSLDTAGNLTLTGTITGSTISGSTFTGSSFTGGIFQTANTANNKVFIRSDGLYAFGATTTPFALDTSGNLVITGGTTAVQMTGGIVQGSTLRTASTPPWVVMDQTGIYAIGTGGVQTFRINAADGVAYLKGTLVTGAGSQIAPPYLDASLGTVTPTAIAAQSILAGHINVTTLSALSANVGTLLSGLIVGPVIRTSLPPGVPALQLDNLGIRAWNSDGSTPLQIIRNPANTNVFDMTMSGGVLTGGAFQTAGTSNSKVMLRSDGLFGYGSTTTPFSLDTAGNLTVTGAIETGGTYTGGAFQTAGTSNSKVILRSDGLIAYGASSTPFILDTSGNASFVGSISSSTVTASTFTGGTFTGGSFTGGSFTGGQFVVSPGIGGATSVYLRSGRGIQAFNTANGATPFSLDLNGDLVVSGNSVVTGGSFTAGVFQTAGTSNNKVMMRSDGIYAFDSTSTPFSVSSSGTAVITGGTVQTALSGVSRTVIDSEGLKTYSSTTPTAEKAMINTSTGVALRSDIAQFSPTGQTLGFYMDPKTAATPALSTPVATIQSGVFSSGNQLILSAVQNAGPQKVTLFAGGTGNNGNLTVNGDAVNASITASAGLGTGTQTILDNAMKSLFVQNAGGLTKRKVDFVVQTINTGAIGANSRFSVAVSHSLGVTPAGAIALVQQGGGIAFNLPLETAHTFGSGSVSFQIYNPGGALGSSTIVIAMICWV